jgi:hypothetical protein
MIFDRADVVAVHARAAGKEVKVGHGLGDACAD